MNAFATGGLEPDLTLLLDGDPETLCLLYQTGLGDRNSQGFGMFRMLL